MAVEPYNPSPIGNPSVLARRNWWQTKLVIFIGKHTPKCNEMVRILSKSMDEPMPLSMRIKKRIHFLICCWCQRYEKQLHYLRDVSRSFPEHAYEAIATPVSVAAKERWKNALRAAPAFSGAGFDSNEELTRAPETSRMSPPAGPSARTPWNFLIVAVAVLLLFFGLRSFWMPASTRSLADFRDEMVSFIKVPPNLELKSPRLSEVRDWIKNSGGPSEFTIPHRVESYLPFGCRVLRFDGRDVTLVCFRRDEGGLVHLFVIDDPAIRGLPERQHADISQQGEWVTAAWSDAGHDYLLAVQGDQGMIKSLLGEQ